MNNEESHIDRIETSNLSGYVYDKLVESVLNRLDENKSTIDDNELLKLKNTLAYLESQSNPIEHHYDDDFEWDDVEFCTDGITGNYVEESPFNPVTLCESHSEDINDYTDSEFMLIDEELSEVGIQETSACNETNFVHADENRSPRDDTNNVGHNHEEIYNHFNKALLNIVLMYKDLSSGHCKPPPIPVTKLFRKYNAQASNIYDYYRHGGLHECPEGCITCAEDSTMNFWNDVIKDCLTSPNSLSSGKKLDASAIIENVSDIKLLKLLFSWYMSGYFTGRMEALLDK